METKQFLQNQIPGSLELLNGYVDFWNMKHSRLILMLKIFSIKTWMLDLFNGIHVLVFLALGIWFFRF